MILSEKYHEIMEHITVTPQMHERISEQLRHADLTTDQTAQPVIRFANRRKYVGMAAGLIVLVAACAVMPSVLKNPGQGTDQDQSSENDVQTTWDYQTYDTIEELAAQMGYELHDIQGLPFEPQTTTYASIGTDMAQIEYQAGDQTAYYRKSPGTEDNSGDYNQYAVTDTVTVGDCEVQLRGQTDGYVLAVWTDGDYAYSLSLSQAQPENVWEQMLETAIGS